MVLLDDRLWSGFSCGSRMLVMPVGAIFVLLAIVFLALLKDVIDRRWWPRPKVEYPSGWTNSALALWSVGSLAAVFLASFIFVILLSPTLTSIRTDGRSVVETGCDRSEVYKTQIDLATADISYHHPKRGRGYSQHFVVVSDARNDIRISLERESNYPVLIKIAPRAMQEFAEWIVAAGRPVPAPLVKLLGV